MTAPLLDHLPYARFLNLRTEVYGDEVTVVMPFSDHLIGNPLIPALHGGSTAALLELTAVAKVSHAFPRLRLPRPINVSVAYLRVGKAADVYARAHIRKAGKKVAYVTAEAWQESLDKPIATLTAHFQLDDSTGD
ncbi:PaaI family thioesterase [uncultured Brevundimonas sp.]|uniref:PaaI family thioesterase n=1 Tax=uncultured Brevundimonas sp. TaxID=213418 RepID=UPI0026125513|nr:PaaI family thioesterase [uncultured Brevundimonas sp.]